MSEVVEQQRGLWNTLTHIAGQLRESVATHIDGKDKKEATEVAQMLFADTADSLFIFVFTPKGIIKIDAAEFVTGQDERGVPQTTLSRIHAIAANYEAVSVWVPIIDVTNDVNSTSKEGEEVVVNMYLAGRIGDRGIFNWRRFAEGGRFSTDADIKESELPLAA